MEVSQDETLPLKACAPQDNVLISVTLDVFQPNRSSLNFDAREEQPAHIRNTGCIPSSNKSMVGCGTDWIIKPHFDTSMDTSIIERK